MFCTKCGKQTNDNVKFCPGCGTTLASSCKETTDEIQSSHAENAVGKSWQKIGKLAVVIVSVVIGIGIAYFRHEKGYAINSRENLAVIANIIKESISSNDDLKPIAKVGECTSVSLDMNSPLESLEDGHVRKVYKGLACVNMFPRKAGESDDCVEYVSKAISVRYDIMVVDAGNEIVLKSADMRDEDWQNLILSIGGGEESDADNKEEEETEEDDDDVTVANKKLPPLDGAEFIKKRSSMTDLQWKRLVNESRGRTIQFKNCIVSEVEEDDENENSVAVLVDVTSSYAIEAKVSEPSMVKLAEKLRPGNKIYMLSGRIKKREMEDNPQAEIVILDSHITMAKANNAGAGKSVADKLLSLMEESNKLTMDAVGWARDPLTDEQKKAFPEKIAAMSEKEQMALLERFQTEYENLKQFIKMGKIADGYRKQQGSSPFLDEQTIKEFLKLSPEQQKELLEKMR